MKADLMTLYKGILYGFCPCHGYNKKSGKTGGFYHMLCRHGVSYVKEANIVQYYGNCLSLFKSLILGKYHEF